jgi:putative flippase GtrA
MSIRLVTVWLAPDAASRHLQHTMRSEPAYYPLIRIAIALGCALLGFVVMGLVGVAVDVPIKAVSQYAASYGAAGSIALGLGIIVGGIALSRWATRRDERRQIAETGTLEHRRPVFVREGLGRNVAMLLAPLALLVLIGLGFWLTGTPFPAFVP